MFTSPKCWVGLPTATWGRWNPEFYLISLLITPWWTNTISIIEKIYQKSLVYSQTAFDSLTLFFISGPIWFKIKQELKIKPPCLWWFWIFEINPQIKLNLWLSVHIISHRTIEHFGSPIVISGRIPVPLKLSWKFFFNAQIPTMIDPSQLSL
jgi:hypothetical protein